ncbi:unnamed protein product [Amoebophrya sp. A25]|nr:unnamed protein product [Amoebophrya sp. A25]|eukprot:GSA25T00008692001.1
MDSATVEELREVLMSMYSLEELEFSENVFRVSRGRGVYGTRQVTFEWTTFEKGNAAPSGKASSAEQEGDFSALRVREGAAAGAGEDGVVDEMTEMDFVIKVTVKMPFAATTSSCASVSSEDTASASALAKLFSKLREDLGLVENYGSMKTSTTFETRIDNLKSPEDRETSLVIPWVIAVSEAIFSEEIGDAVGSSCSGIDGTGRRGEDEVGNGCQYPYPEDVDIVKELATDRINEIATSSSSAFASALVHIDHMNNSKKYFTALESLAKGSQCRLTVVVAGSTSTCTWTSSARLRDVYVVVISLSTRPKANGSTSVTNVRNFLKGLREDFMDEDKHGKACRERCATVLMPPEERSGGDGRVVEENLAAKDAGQQEDVSVRLVEVSNQQDLQKFLQNEFGFLI